MERDTPLAAKKAIPQAQLDTEIKEKLGAEAAVQSAKAAMERAELDLGWTKVTSLVDGVAGIAEVQMGNLVGPTSQLTSVSQMDPIKVYFPVSEQQYLRAKHVAGSGTPMDLFDTRAGADPGRRHRLSPQGQDSADGPSGGQQHRNHSSGRCIPESRQRPPPRPIRAGADRDRHEERTRCWCRRAR